MKKLLLLTILLFGINSFGQEANKFLDQATADFTKLATDFKTYKDLNGVEFGKFNNRSNNEAFYQLQFGYRFSIGISDIKTKTQ
jgi:hypothetical protein